MNPVVEKKWMDIRDMILNEIADLPDIVVHIPLWQPVGLEQGLSWLRSTVYEGYFVGYRVEHSASRTTLFLKSWEFGEEEPECTPA
jgi:hypothetical protein